MRPDELKTRKDELVQMTAPCSRGDTNPRESDEKEPLSFTLELGEVDQTCIKEYLEIILTSNIPRF